MRVELILQGSTIKELEHTQIGNKLEKNKFQFYEIMVRYHDRASEVLSCQLMRLEDLKEVLMNPANCDVFFSNSGYWQHSKRTGSTKVNFKFLQEDRSCCAYCIASS